MSKTFKGKPILSLDFDGVIHSYTSGWKGAANIPDPPVPGVGIFLLKAVQSFKVAIFSSRSHQWGGRRAMRAYVREILWDACLSETSEMERAWQATQCLPPDYIPWTAYDVRDVADHIHRKIGYPLFKPAALMSIDDRALTFNGDWSDPAYGPEAIKAFKPWNKRQDRIEPPSAPIELPYGVGEGDLGSIPL